MPVERDDIMEKIKLLVRNYGTKRMADDLNKRNRPGPSHDRPGTGRHPRS